MDFVSKRWISDVENLRHMQFRRKQNEKRKKGPRGPRPKVLAMKLYHLPEASQVPFFPLANWGLPFQLEKSKYYPSSKMGSRQDKKNYRPLSLLLNFGKILEKSDQWRSHGGGVWGKYPPTFLKYGILDSFKKVVKILG